MRRPPTIDYACVACFERDCFGCDIFERSVDPEMWDEYTRRLEDAGEDDTPPQEEEEYEIVGNPCGD